MGLGQQITAGMNRLYDSARHPASFKVTDADAPGGSLAALRGHKFGLVVTFRRNGQAVPSPVWMAVDVEGRLYVKTGAASGKIKRIRRNPSVLVAASTFRGRPTSPVHAARARVLPRDEWAHAEATLADAFGLDRKIYRRVFPASETQAAYLEVIPAQE